MSALTPRKRPTRSRAPLRFWPALALSLGSGLVLALAFQPLDWWPLVFPAVAAMLWSVRGRSLRGAAVIGAAHSAAFYVPHIWWITVYLGAPPLIGLVMVMVVWGVLGAMLLALAWQWGERFFRTQASRTFALPALLAGLWTAREAVASTFPFGGFAWGRVAHSQASSPIGDAISWVGMSGLSFLLVFVSAIFLQLLLIRGTMARRRFVTAAAVAVALVAIPVFPTQTTGTIRVGAVQGNSQAGLFAEYVPGQIIAEHADASQLLAGETMDVLVWPENAGEWMPHERRGSTEMIEEIVDQFDVPLVLGAITAENIGEEDEQVFNSLQLWEPGAPATETYHKRHPVPFAEYLPARDFFYPLAPDLFDLIPRDYSVDPSSANAFRIDDFVAGLAICFDIVDDALTREMILDHGAEILFAPTNNADFGEGSAENVQQLAIAQLRAMETGRALVNISTVGTSAMVLPDGTMVERLTQYEAGVMLADLPLSSTVTPAVAFGAWIELVLCLGAILLLGALGIRSFMLQRRTTRG
ncbi:apolipoprotein N-acyltransferase [Humidisolicoccus flavus]|uniref:apolipoprotein N-acyltransferase n=1 Tax=Humidisolicoccus flavus TaxID=3111414 RepID=UPI003248109F